MKKYKPANLQSVKEFIQRMLDGERFYNQENGDTFYFDVDWFYVLTKTNESFPFTPNIANINLLQVETPYTIQDAIAEKPMLCWVWDGEESNPRKILVTVTKYTADSPYPFRTACGGFGFVYAELATLEEIKQYLGD